MPTIVAYAVRIALFIALATLSHPLLDMCTNGRLGCALFAPFSSKRYFFPFRPIHVAPIGVHGLLSERGWNLLLSELTFVIGPSILLLIAARFRPSR